MRLRWAIQTDTWAPGAGETQLLLSLLGQGEAQRVARFVNEDDRKRALLSHLLQRAACQQAVGVPFREARIVRTKGGKPFLADAHGCAEAPNWNFNVSHEGAFVVLAAEPRLLCGVDVAAPSQLRRRGAPQPAAELLELLSAQFSPSERDAVLGAGSEEARADTLRALWSLKEAYVKARGDGLGFDLSRATFGWAPAAAADPAADPPAEAILLVDGVPQSAAWRFTMQKLGGRAADGCHWVSVALGPPSAAVDAQGSFRATFRCPAAELSAVEAGDAPPFSLLTVFDLIPDEARPAYLAAGGEPFF